MNGQISWEKWLDKDLGDYLTNLRNTITNIYEQDRKKHKHLPFFTPHGIAHCQAVENPRRRKAHRTEAGDCFPYSKTGIDGLFGVTLLSPGEHNIEKVVKRPA